MGPRPPPPSPVNMPAGCRHINTTVRGSPAPTHTHTQTHTDTHTNTRRHGDASPREKLTCHRLSPGPHHHHIRLPLSLSPAHGPSHLWAPPPLRCLSSCGTVRGSGPGAGGSLWHSGPTDGKSGDYSTVSLSKCVTLSTQPLSTSPPLSLPPLSLSLLVTSSERRWDRKHISK